MWIRSQDKKTIFDMTGSNIEIRIDNSICGYRNTVGNDDLATFLGNYPTEKRAIEVLEDICHFYVGLNAQDGMGCYFGGYVKNGVFQMPEV